MDRSGSEEFNIAERTAELEMALIKEYLAKHAGDEHAMTPEQAEKLWKEALLYASLRLEEVKARARLVGDLHNQPAGM